MSRAVAIVLARAWPTPPPPAYPRASERFAALLGLPAPAPLTADEEAAYHAKMRAADNAPATSTASVTNTAGRHP